MKMNQLLETPIDMTGDPNDPVVYGHEKANPMTLKGRIMSARAQLKELAELAESNDLVAWEKITRLAKGGMFMGLEQNLEQIRHGIGELAAKRRKGGVQSRGIDRNIGEQGVAEGLGEYVPLAIFLGMLYTWYKNTKTKEPTFKVFINGKDVSTKLLTKAEAVHVIKNLAKQEHDTKTQYAIVDTKTNNIVFRRTWSDNPDITGGSPSWVDSNESVEQGVAKK